MDIKKIKTAISLLNSMVECGEKHSPISQEAVINAFGEIRKFEESKERWFRVLDDGSVGTMTTPHGYGKKILCKIVPFQPKVEIKRCSKCGQVIMESEVTS